MRKFTLLSIFVHCAIEVSYIGTMYNITRLPGDPNQKLVWFLHYFSGNVYYNSIMQGFSEVFGNLISIPFVKYIGVKKTGILFNAVAGLSMILTIIMLEVDPKRYSFYHGEL